MKHIVYITSLNHQVETFEEGLEDDTRTRRVLYTRLQYLDSVSGNKPPSETYGEDQAKKAIDNAKEVLKAVGELIESVE